MKKHHALEFLLLSTAVFLLTGQPAAQTVHELETKTSSLRDQATGTCLQASSIPTSGSLWTLGSELFIDAAGRVGISTPSPGERLTVGGRIEATQSGFVFPDGTHQGGAAWGGAQGWTPGRVATLRYRAGGNAGLDFGRQHDAMAFDGEFVWITTEQRNELAAEVWKLRSSDAGLEASYGLGGAEGPYEIALDGAHVWVLCTWFDAGNYFTRLVKLRASDGQLLDTATLYQGPDFTAFSGLVFDGQALWVAERTGDQIHRIRLDDPRIVQSVTVGGAPTAIAVVGDRLWVTNAATDDVTVVRSRNGMPIATFPAGNWPTHLAYDGSSVWILNHVDDLVTRIRVSDGANLGSFPTHDNPLRIVFDGNHLWVTHAFPLVRRFDARNGVILGDHLFGGIPSVFPQAAVFDGAGMWFTLNWEFEPRSFVYRF